jgi:hypothetical protein
MDAVQRPGHEFKRQQTMPFERTRHGEITSFVRQPNRL